MPSMPPPALPATPATQLDLAGARLTTSKMSRNRAFDSDLEVVLDELIRRVNEITQVVIPLAGILARPNRVQQSPLTGVPTRYPTSVTAPSGGITPPPTINTSNRVLLQGYVYGYNDENHPALAIATSTGFVRATAIVALTSAPNSPLSGLSYGPARLILDPLASPAAGDPIYLSWTTPGTVTNVRPPSDPAIRRQMLGTFTGPRDPASGTAFTELALNQIVSGST